MNITVKTFLLFFFSLSVVSCTTVWQDKQLDYKKITPAGTKKTIPYGVYTPPNWNAGEQLPVIIFLHGAGSSYRSFERFGANTYLDEQISQGNIPRVILVSPEGGFGFWENWADGTHHYRDWVIDDILPLVQKDYNTLNCPTHCHVMGLSMGGFGALRFSYLSDQKFSSVSSISAPIIGDEEKEKTDNSLLIRLLFPFKRIFGEGFSNNYKENTIENAFLHNGEFLSGKKDDNLDKIRLQLIIGDNDIKQMIINNRRFHKGLVAHNRDHEYIVYEGRHKWKDWIPTFSKAINFLVDDTRRIKKPAAQ